MIHKLAKKISYWNTDSLKLNECERQVVEYGLEVFMDGLGKLMILCLVGVGLDKTSSFLCVILAFCSLRYWAGGVHCKTNIGCLGAMIFISVVSVYGAELLQDIPQVVRMVVMLLCLGAVIWKAPGQTDNTPRLNEESEIMKRKGSIVCALLLYILIFLIKETYWKVLILFSVFFETLSIIPCKGNITNFLLRRKKL